MAANLRRGVQIWNAITRGTRNFDRVAKKAEVTAFGDGCCSCKMVVSEEHENRVSSLHGGFTATLIDMVTTLAIMSKTDNIPGVSTDMSISYLKAARNGDEVIIDAVCTKAGKYLAFTTADLKLADGTLIAQGKHTKFIGNFPRYELKESE